MIAVVLRVVLATVLAAPAVETQPLPPPRPVAPGRAVHRPPSARPIAVATVGLGALTLASCATLVGLGIHSMLRAPRGRTEGEANAYTHNGKNLVIVGSTVASAGIALLVGGIVWVVRDRRRPRATAMARR